MRLTSIEDDFKNILKEEEQMFSMEDRILEWIVKVNFRSSMGTYGPMETYEYSPELVPIWPMGPKEPRNA